MAAICALQPIRKQGALTRGDLFSVALGPLADIVGFHPARATVTSTDAFERFIGQPFDLKQVEFSLLMVAMANRSMAPKPLAQALMVTSPNLTLLLDRLQQRGLINRECNPAGSQ